MLKIGEHGAVGLYAGEAKIQKAYLGEELVFSAEKKPSRLPEGYTEIEYITIESASSYIEIATAIRSNSKLEFRGELVQLPSTTGFIFNYVPSGNNRLFLNVSSASYLTGFCVNSSTVTSAMQAQMKISSETFPYAIDFAVDLSGSTKKVYLNEKSVTASWALNTQYAFRIGKPSTGNALVGCRIKHLKMSSTTYESTSSSYPKFNCELIPCVNSDGKACLYDLINNKVYVANGTFTPGPAV